MNLKDKNIGFAITGSYYNYKNILDEIKRIKKLGANVIPIMSFNALNIDTRFRHEP